MVYKSSPIEASVCQRDSEFGFVLKMFSFGKVDEILDRLEKCCFRDLSSTIVFAEDLERTVTIGR